MIPFAAFLLGFGFGYFRVARSGGKMADRIHRGIVTGLALTLASLLLEFLFEAVLKA